MERSAAARQRVTQLSTLGIQPGLRPGRRLDIIFKRPKVVLTKKECAVISRNVLALRNATEAVAKFWDKAHE